MEQTHSSENIYTQVDNYDWDNDVEFQGGLRAIISSAPPDQAPRLLLRARCYYFARKFAQPVDFEGYLNWVNSAQSSSNNGNTTNGVASEHSETLTGEQQQQQQEPKLSHANDISSNTATAPSLSSSQTSTASPMGNAPPPASFAEICELIAAGKPIPGIKDIPDTVLEGQASQSQASQRKKPWEKDAAPAPPPAWARAS